MERIITAKKGLELIYSSEFNKSFFEVEVVSLDSSKRKSLKFPLGIAESELNAKLSLAVASGSANAAALSATLALEHCNLYRKNIYFLYTLLHDPGLHSFISWLQEWYVRNFLASLTSLAMESPAFTSGGLQDRLRDASGNEIAVTVGHLLTQIENAGKKPE